MTENCIKCGATQDLSEFKHAIVDTRVSSISFRKYRPKVKQEITNIRKRTVLVCPDCKRKFKNVNRMSKFSGILSVLFLFFIVIGNMYIFFATDMYTEDLSQGIGGVIAAILGIIMLTGAVILYFLSKMSKNHPDFIIAEQYFSDAMERKIVDPKDSLHRFDKALDVFKKYKEAYYEKGKVYQQLGRLRSALENFNKALKIDPLYEKAKISRKEILQILSKPRDQINL